MTPETTETDRLVAEAASAAPRWAATSRADRAAALDTVADALDAAADRLVPIAMRETHLPEARLRGELKRTTFQLRLLADTAREGAYLDVRIDHPDAEWPMGAPRPDLRRSSVPLGPVVVFAASNFPFAFSVAGGDVAAALAAGCPVLVKAHGGHPDLSDATAAVVRQALADAGAPAGLFALVHSEEAGRALLTHSQVKAGAFTGSIPAGRTLFDLAQSRPEPIPFFGELGSVNPVLVTQRAADGRAAEIADGFIGSFTLGAGQFCTKPGVLLVPSGSALVERLAAAQLPDAAPLLNERIETGHADARRELGERPGVRVLAGSATQSGGPLLLRTSLATFLDDLDGLFVECFGPTALVVTYDDERELLHVVPALGGQLTATLIGEDDDELAPRLVTELARIAGRVLWNQWPTGVSVTYAQQHGGPYPASTAPASTSVGTAAIGRFVRPVAWQGFPEHLLPAEVREQDTDVPRRVDGAAVGAAP